MVHSPSLYRVKGNSRQINTFTSPGNNRVAQTNTKINTTIYIGIIVQGILSQKCFNDSFPDKNVKATIAVSELCKVPNKNYISKVKMHESF